MVVVMLQITGVAKHVFPTLRSIVNVQSRPFWRETANHWHGAARPGWDAQINNLAGILVAWPWNADAAKAIILCSGVVAALDRDAKE